MSLTIGIDVGGTKVAARAVDDQDRIAEKLQRSTPPRARFFSVLSYGSRRSPGTGAQFQSGIQVFTARHRGNQVWNGAAIGPAFPRQLAVRTGNTPA